MSIAVPCKECRSFSYNPFIGSGPDFERLKKYYDDVVNRFRETETIRGPLEKTLESLKQLYEECSEEGWDGYNANPITQDAYFEAKKIIDLLPIYSLPMPEIVPEPDGGIALEWYKAKRFVFIISVIEKNEIVYAGLFGPNKTHGTEFFIDNLPQKIIENLRRLYFQE